MKFGFVCPWIAAAGLLGGCSSGGQAVAPIPAPARATHSSSHVAAASVKIVIPQRVTDATLGRKANFVSPSTAGASVEVTHSTNGVVDYDVTTDFDLTGASASASCSGTNPETCTLEIPAPVTNGASDFDSFKFTLYDQAPGGTPPSFGNAAVVLGTGSTTSAIVVNTANTISAYIDGLPTSIEFGLVSGTPPSFVRQIVASGDGYLGFTATVDVDALDAEMNVISAGAYDPFVPSIALGVATEQKPTDSTTLAVTPLVYSVSPAPPACNTATTTPVQTITTCRSSDTITATYAQAATATFTRTYYATITSATSAVKDSVSLYVAPDFIADTTDPASSTTKASYKLGAANLSPVLELRGTTGTVSLASPGTAKEGTMATFTAALNANCANDVSGINMLTTTEFQITGAQPLTTANDGCAVIFTDSFGGTVQLDITDTP